MTYYVRAQNGVVTDCWDTPPPVGQEGWKIAVEVKPELPSDQYYDGHYFALDVEPVEIRWNVKTYTAEQLAENAKQALARQNKPILDQIAELELKGIRAIREGDAVRIKANDDAIVALRTQLVF